MSYWEPAHGNDGTMGLGVLAPISYQSITDAQQIFGLVKINKGQLFTYYTGAAWSKAEQFTSAAQWIAYLMQCKKGEGKIKCVIE